MAVLYRISLSFTGIVSPVEAIANKYIDSQSMSAQSAHHIVSSNHIVIPTIGLLYDVSFHGHSQVIRLVLSDTDHLYPKTSDSNYTETPSQALMT